ncbi:ABC transporter ATP-binding protein [Cellulomonas hominis]|nr:ABC transporter ATP-binding protein [Cellulomonas hominis]
MTSSTPQGGGASGPRCRIGARGVSRSFGPVRANVDVDLAVAPGTVHALIGENGAGKSTLMRILYGLDRPDAGSVVLDDQPVVMASPRDAIARGIGLVQQELAIIPELTLLENLVLGDEPHRGPVIDRAAARRRAEELARAVHVEVDWSARAAHTSIAIQQQVEILRLLHRGARTLILDEPTAVLAPAQADELLRLLTDLAAQGHTVVFISHKLDEVVTVADEITVLRGGRTVAHHRRGEVDRAGLARAIIGDGEVAPDRTEPGTPGEPVLEVQDVRARDDLGAPRLDGVSFALRSGEILGIAAVAGNGQEELAEALAGIRATTGGRVALRTADGTRDLTTAGVRERRRHGVAYISADRKHEGLSVSTSLEDNAVATPRLGALSRWGVLRRAAVRDRVEAVLTRASVRYGSVQDPASSLSGGNQQRLVVGRETLDRPRAVIASQPTRGVDIRGIGHIHELLRRSRDDGAGIVLFSEEIDELRALSDRVLVLHRGTVAGELPGTASRAEIGALMVGSAQGSHDELGARAGTEQDR